MRQRRKGFNEKYAAVKYVVLQIAIYPIYTTIQLSGPDADHCRYTLGPNIHSTTIIFVTWQLPCQLMVQNEHLSIIIINRK